MIIGISGKMQHGKDSVASFLKNNLYNWEIRKFADKVKQIAEILTGIPKPDFELNAIKQSSLGAAWSNMTVRELLQRLGTEAVRNKLHVNAWVNSLLVEYTPSSKWIISDVRFPNEAAAIKAVGGVLVRVVRPNYAQASTHESELALDDYPHDYYINNDGDLTNLNKLSIETLVDLKLI